MNNVGGGRSFPAHRVDPSPGPSRNDVLGMQSIDSLNVSVLRAYDMLQQAWQRVQRILDSCFNSFRNASKVSCIYVYFTVKSLSVI